MGNQQFMDTPLGRQFLEGVPRKGSQQQRNRTLREDPSLPPAVARTLAGLDVTMNHFAGLTGKAAALEMADRFDVGSPHFDKMTTKLARKGGVSFDVASEQFTTVDPRIAKAVIVSQN